MQRTLLSAALIAGASLFAVVAHGATFNYHGNLQDAGKPAEGSYDLELTLYSAAEGGHILAGPLLMYQVPVQGGSFSTEADFGPLSNASGQSWLGVKVRKAGNGEFAALSARAPLASDAVTASTCPGSWALEGNAGNAPGSYLGTTDSPLVFKANNTQVATAFTTAAAGPVPLWIGGLYNVYNGQGGFVGGGGGTTSSDVDNANYVRNFATIGGGQDNIALDWSVATGGIHNHVENNYAVIGGGENNEVDNIDGTIGGGNGNLVHANGGTVGGGVGNTATIGTSGGDQQSTVAGGHNNTAAWASAVGGGSNNVATGEWSTIAGGHSGVALQGFAAVGGGEGNLVYGGWSTVPGGFSNLAGAGQSLAAGSFARTRITGPAPTTLPAFVYASDYTGSNTIDDSGTFVWADTTGGGARFTSNGGNKFMALATGGVDFVTGRSGATWTSGVHLAAGGGSWSSISDRNVKTQWLDVDSAAILQRVADLPITTWRYIAQDSGIRHIGPMAQDFYSAFNVGEDDRHITQVDEGGVALAAIQGLNAKVDAKEKRLEQENAELRSQLEAVLVRLDQLEAHQGQ